MKLRVGRSAPMILLVAALMAATLPVCDSSPALQLLDRLQRDGHLNPEMAAQIKVQYADLLQAPLGVASRSSWQRYMSLSSFIKVVGIGFLLIAFSRVIKAAAARLCALLVKVPVEVLQGVLLTWGLSGIFCSSRLFPSNAFYVTLFCAFANLILLAWIIGSHVTPQQWKEMVAALERRHISPHCLASFCSMLYFGALAVVHSSQLFGVFAIIGLSGLTSFGLLYSPGTLVLQFDSRSLNTVIFCHIAILTLYSCLSITHLLPIRARVFEHGINYYCTMAMGTGFLVGASPFRWMGQQTRPAAYMLLFVLTFAAAMAGYFLADLQAIGGVLCVFATLLAIEWIGFFSYRRGLLVSTFAVGIVLYCIALLIEQYGHHRRLPT